MSDLDGRDTSPAWAPELAELERRAQLGAEMGGAEAVARHRAQGRLTIRERIERLCDQGSFNEIGRLTAHAAYGPDGELHSLTPANYLFGGARIDQRRVVIAGYDYTVRGGASDAGILDKRSYAERMAHDQKVPLVRLVEGAGGSVRSIEKIGATYVPNVPGWEWSVANLSRVPVVAAALGPLAGLPAIEVTSSHFSVMVKGQAQVFIAGPPVVAASTRSNADRDIDKEALGGWEVATRSGSVDNAVDTEDDALALIRRFLSYLPSNVWQLPARATPDDDPNRADVQLRDIVPRNRRRTFAVRDLLRRVADIGSITEIAPAYGRALVGTLARLDGYPVAMIGTDSRVDGGGLSADAAFKLARFIDLADTFHLPVVAFIDHPGLLIGLDAERAGTLRAGCRALAAVYEAEMPWASVIVRRAFGVAGATHRNPARHTFRVAWPSATWGSLPLEGGVEAAYRRLIESAPDPEAARAELFAKLERSGSPFRTAEIFGVEDVIDPAETRPRLCDWVAGAYESMAAGDVGPSGRRFPPMITETSFAGVLEHIHFCAAASADMQACSSARLVAGSGIEGDRYALGTGTYSNRPHSDRQVTLIERETLDALARDVRVVLEPHEHRRNLTTRGVPLNHLVGRYFRVGECVLFGGRLNVPCRYLEERVGRPVFQPLVHRSGLNARVNDH